MRFIILHKTNAHWEAGARPGPELIARVGSLLGELAAAGVLVSAEGLRPSCEGVRLRFSGGKRTVIKGPFDANHELPAGFTILRTQSIDDDAGRWAERYIVAVGAEEVDVLELEDIVTASSPTFR